MTRGSNVRPTRRLCQSGRTSDEFVLEVRESVITIRPKGARSKSALVTLEVGTLWQTAIVARLEAERAKKRRRR